MDPQATINQLRYAVHERQYSRAVELLTAYYEWRIKGGFEPLNGDQRVAVLSNQLQDALENL
jgi:hypothetical protein